MNTILYMAMSVNGYVAHSDGGEDFLSDDGWMVLAELVKESGNFVVGRTTYEATPRFHGGYPDGPVEIRLLCRLRG